MRDYRVGEVRQPAVSLAQAVAASSAFPPVLSPMEMRLDPNSFTPNSGMDLQRPPFTSKVVLTDGGVYDNLGLETVWKNYDTVLVSDGGGKMREEEEPKTDWPRHAYRVLGLIDNQVRSLRVRQLIDSYDSGVRKGAYWGIRTDVRDYQLPDALNCPFDRTTELAHTPTRLKRLDDTLQERIINWGYAVCDAALRKHVNPALPPPTFPYPQSGV
jgi:NTE family protein